MTGRDPVPLRIAALRAEMSELGAAIRQLRNAGLDNAAAELLLARKRAELEGLLRPAPADAAPASPAQPAG